MIAIAIARDYGIWDVDGWLASIDNRTYQELVAYRAIEVEQIAAASGGTDGPSANPAQNARLRSGMRGAAAALRSSRR